jgi:hypothetical protein
MPQFKPGFIARLFLFLRLDSPQLRPLPCVVSIMINARFSFVVLLCAVGVGLHAAEESDAPKTNMRDVLKARIAEDAKKAAPAPAATANGPQPSATATTSIASTTKSETPANPPAPSPESPANAKANPAAKTATKDKKKPEQTTVMPKVEVKKGRITVLDQQIAQQEQDIAREKKNTKPSEVDTALNDAKVAKPLSIFGGESTQFRKRVASERVELMEAEKDILEAMKLAKTKEEKAMLQKQLDELRAYRRELDKSLR